MSRKAAATFCQLPLCPWAEHFKLWAPQKGAMRADAVSFQLIDGVWLLLWVCYDGSEAFWWRNTIIAGSDFHNAPRAGVFAGIQYWLNLPHRKYILFKRYWTLPPPKPWSTNRELSRKRHVHTAGHILSSQLFALNHSLSMFALFYLCLISPEQTAPGSV